MGVSRLYSTALIGLEARLIEVEVDAERRERGQVVIVGLPDNAVRESKDRVIAALKNSGYPIEFFGITVNLAPGNLRKEGALYDFPISIGILLAIGAIPPIDLENFLFVGELGLSGELRPVYGSLSTAMMMRRSRKEKLFLPAVNGPEAAAVPEVACYPITTLKEAVALLVGERSGEPLKPLSREEYATALSQANRTDSSRLTKASAAIDFSEVQGQYSAKRALEIAAAGGHNVLMCGPPGSGKTMLAKALLGILPEMDFEEALEVTQIHSLRGLNRLQERGVVLERPWRAPHHTISDAGLIGGGVTPQPGEVSLAHRGILFLDELPEFSRAVLEVLRQPLEDCVVTISRAQGQVTFPTQFLFVAAMNPCPCGLRGHPEKPCRCSGLQVERYLSKISGPLLDRIDLHIEVPAVRYEQLSGKKIEEPSQAVRQRVIAARMIQEKRLGNARSNSTMLPRELKLFCSLCEVGEQLLQRAVDLWGLSGRGVHRVTKVARTIADLESCEEILPKHLSEALALRGSLGD